MIRRWIVWRDFWHVNLHGKRVYRDAENTMLWTMTKSGKFIVNSLYNALELDNFESFPIRGIWLSWV